MTENKLSLYSINKSLETSLINFFYNSDQSLTELVIKYGYQPFIIKKEVNYGDHSSVLFNRKTIVCFALTYTLFEEINDHGERPNDIYMDVILTANSSGNLQIDRHIGSGFDDLLDIDYENYIYTENSFNDFLKKLDSMLIDFKYYFMDVINKTAKVVPNKSPNVR